jgi:hypothetical protein
VIGMTKSIAADFVTRGIRCNAICPGTVESPSLRAAHRGAGASERADVEQVQAAFVARQPMGRLGRPRRSPRSRCTSRRDESASPPAPPGHRRRLVELIHTPKDPSMKLMRHGPKGGEARPVDAQGQVRDLSGVLADITLRTRSCRLSRPQTSTCDAAPVARAASRRPGAAWASSSASA